MKYIFFIKWGIITLVIFGALYTVFNAIDSRGYDRAKAECAIVVKDYEDKVLNRLTKIEENSSVLILNNKTVNDAMSVDIATILSKVKGKALVVVKDGKCVPSQTFSDTIDAVNKRVNQSMKDSQK